MRRACTFAIKGGSSVLVFGPEVPLPEQLRAFKAARGVGSFDGAEALEVWITGGSVRRAKFKAPAAPAAEPNPPAEQSPAAESQPEKINRKKSES